ncbi:MAG: hypothetical protein RSF86_14450 [Angelakisella sp.]
MKDYKHSCVIDAEGCYITLVLVLFEPADTGEITEEIQGYTLKSGEYIIDTAPPSGFIKPQWQDSTWKEAATAAEIAAWEKAHPAPPVPPPTENERLRADVDFLAAMGGVAL